MNNAVLFPVLSGFFSDALLLLLSALCTYAVWKIPPYRKKRNFLYIGAGLLATNLLAVYLDTLSGGVALSVLSYLLTVLPHYLLITLLYRKINLKCYAVTLACRVVSLGFSYLTVLLKYPGVFDLGNIGMYSDSLRIDILCRAVLCVPAAFWCIRSLRRSTVDWASFITTPVFLLCSGLFLSYFVLVWLLLAPQALRVDMRLTASLIVLFTVIFFTAIPYVLHHLIRSRYFGSFVKAQLDTQVAFYEEMQKRNRDMHAFRHDYMNYMQCIRDLLQDGKTADAIAFMDAVNADLSATRQEFYSGNFLLDAILSDKQAKAAAFNTAIHWDGAFPRDGIENVDLCAMLSNALDNAIEACKKIDGDCIVTVHAKQEEDRVYLRIQNPIPHEVHIRDGVIETTKPDKISHGFGLLNIKKAAEKYDGSMNPSISDDGLFTLDIELRYR